MSVWIVSTEIEYLLSEQKEFQNKSKNNYKVYQSVFFRCIMLLSYRVTFLCNVLVKLIIHQKALYDIFYEKVVKWCKKRIVIINDIRFKGKRNIDWEEVEEYSKKYVDNCYKIAETSDHIFIGADFPGELAGSTDTQRLRGANAKAKANATQNIPLLLQYAINRRWQKNYKSKHNIDTKFGWYRFTTRFALPVYNNDGDKLERFNIFRIELLVRHAANGNLYLYDMVNIKKETSTPPRQ